MIKPPSTAIAAALAAMALASNAANPELPKDVRDAALAEIKAQAEKIVDGVYFGLPKEIYHAVERLSTSALQAIDISAATWWRDSWLNPNPPQATAEQFKSRERTRAIGTAYHAARLEPDLFAEMFVRKLNQADFIKLPEHGEDQPVFTGTQIEAALVERGETKKKAGEKVLDQGLRLIESGYKGWVFPVEEAKWEQDRAGRIALDAITWDEITVDMQRLHGSGKIAERLTGGQAEVSIFWTDSEGRKMKARLDYLTYEHWVDFKTFANPSGKKVANALIDAFQYNRYHMQAVVYRDAVEAIRVHGLQIVGDATDEQRELIDAIQLRRDELDCYYIFQEKGGVPNLFSRRCKFFVIPLSTQANHAITEDGERIAEVERVARRKSKWHSRADRDIRIAKEDFDLYSQVYNRGQPWHPIYPDADIEDLDFRDFWLDGG